MRVPGNENILWATYASENFARVGKREERIEPYFHL